MEAVTTVVNLVKRRSSVSRLHSEVADGEVELSYVPRLVVRHVQSLTPDVGLEHASSHFPAAVLFAVATGKPGFEPGGFASNGFGALSPGGYGLQAALLIEIVLTAGFLIVILGATSSAAPSGFAPVAIGLALTLIHLVSIPVTNTSVNPARSTGAALFAETAALPQLWLFWVAPLVGAVLGALIWSFLLMPEERRT